MSPDGLTFAFLCNEHKAEEGRERQSVSNLLDGIRRAEWRELAGGDVRIVSLYCETCRQRLSTDRYPGPKCPECMRVTMVVGASEKQTTAIESLRSIIEQERKQIMAREHTEAAPATRAAPTLTERASTVASAIGLDEMAALATARQLVKLAKAPLVAGLAARLKVAKPREFTRAVRAFLDSELGHASLSVALGGIMRYAPFVPEQYRETLSHAMVVDGGATALDFAADILMGPVREALGNAVGVLADPAIGRAINAGGGVHVDFAQKANAEVGR